MLQLLLDVSYLLLERAVSLHCILSHAKLILLLRHHIPLFEGPCVLLVRELLSGQLPYDGRLPPGVVIESIGRSRLLVEYVRMLIEVWNWV